MRAFILLLASAATLCADTTLLLDGFDFPSSPGSTNTDVNFNIPARQSGTTPTTYTQTLAGSGSNDALLEDSALFGSDVLLLRTIHGSAASQTAVRADTNYAAGFVGQKWAVTYVGRLDRGDVAITEGWLAFAVGDQPNFTGPNGATADFGFVVQGSGSWVAFVDGALPPGGSGGAGTLRSPDLWSGVFNVTITVDETLAQPTARASVVVGASTFNFGPWNVAFDNASDRYVELRANNGAGGTAAGALMDARVNTVVVTQINGSAQQPLILTAPQPQSLWVGDPLSLNVSATGAAPLTYQWKRNNTAIPGATGTTYSKANALASDGGTYTVEVTNSAGSASASAVVSVVFPTPAQTTWEPPGPSNRRTGLVISEIHYHPEARGDGRELEFIELYNSEPWVEELGGYRFTDDIGFTFPAGTVIPAKGRLVIARVPGDVQANYGIGGVLGPFTGNLSNEGGSVRLRKPSGGIVQEVAWNDHAPWPVAADGSGHSLVLVRPSYGAGDARAWAASPLRGGSPGAGDVAPASGQDHVVINEVLARSVPPLEDFVELHNAAPSSVDLSGCTLSDDPAALGKFLIPANTVLPAGGFASFTEAQLGFALSAEGETLYLTNASGTRVLDAVRFGGQAADVSSGRMGGSGEWRPLAARTPGALNSAPRTPEVLISELFFNPISRDDLDEWLELTNAGAAPVDVSAWRFSDGISFVIPAGTTIAAGGRLVVAKSAERTRSNHPSLNPAMVVGGYEGTLGNGGDHVSLVRPETVGGITVDVDVDSVRYGEKSRWSRWADGGGSSLEVTDLRADRTFASTWADSDESAKAPWTTISASGPLDLGYAGLSGADRVQFFLMGAGETLVDNVVVAPAGGGSVVTNGGFDTGLTGWTLQGNQSRSSVVAGQGFGGGNAMLVRASDDGSPEGNRIFAPLTTTLAPNSSGSISAQARWLRGHPEMILRLKGGYLEAFGTLTVPANLGTPGAPNSRAVNNAGPAISEVSHRPLLPAANVPIRVFARLSDPDGINGATLRWRLESSGSFTNVPMHDDGINGDMLAGDGVFTGAIPGQNAGLLVVFRVEATDAAAAPASALFPPDAPAHECLVRVGEPAQGGDFNAYRMWLTSANVNQWAARAKYGDEPVDVTFVYNQTRAVYGAGAWYAGSEASTPGYNSPVGGLCGYNVTLPGDDRLLEEDHITLDWPIRDVTDQREQLMFWMAEQLRLPNMYRRYVHVFVNGQRRGTIYDDIQQPDSTTIDEFFSGNTEGHLYKTNLWNESPDAGGSVHTPQEPNILRHYDSGGQHKLARYRWPWRPRAGTPANDFTPLFTLIDAVNIPTSSRNYRAAVEAQVDIENWMRTFAFHDLCSFWDSFGNPNLKNTYLYKPRAGRWAQFTFDMDVGLGVFVDPVDAPLFPGTADARVDALQIFPAFQRIYWRTITEAFATFFSGAGVAPQLQKKHNALAANGIGVTSPFAASGAYGLSIPQWIDQRRAFIQGQLNGANAAFALTSPTAVTVSTPTVTFTGTTPLSTETLTVNGVAPPVTWTTPTAWRITVVPAPGTNPYVIRAHDFNGAQIGTATVTVTYTGTSAWPQLRIDEWLAANDGNNADPADGDFDDWLELFNPTAAAVPLDGWTLADSAPDPGVTYVIPAGFVIPAGGRLLVWCDDEAAQSGAPGNLHVPFKLTSTGETLTLRAPDGTLTDTVTFGQQYDNISQGRTSDGSAIAYLSTPSPGSENAGPPPAPTVAVSRSGNIVTFTLGVVPNFRYGIEYKNELADAAWTPLGPATIATSPTLTFSDPNAVVPRRFYRAVRTP